MTAPIVTREALACIARSIDREQMQDPLVAVAWSRGQADLKRGAVGEAVWEQEPPGWVVTVIDLAEVEKTGAWSSPIVEMHGYRFSLRGKPESPQLEGCTLACEAGELVIHERTS